MAPLPCLHIRPRLQQRRHRLGPAVVGHNVQRRAAVAGGGAAGAAGGFWLLGCRQVSAIGQQGGQVAEEDFLAAGGVGQIQQLLGRAGRGGLKVQRGSVGRDWARLGGVGSCWQAVPASTDRMFGAVPAELPHDSNYQAHSVPVPQRPAALLWTQL